MTLGEFIKKWNGKICDYDGYYGGQCVDLYRMYLEEVLEFNQSPPVEGAKDIWDSYNENDFIRISNTPEGVPSEGDVVIWGSGAGKYGHVAIFLDGTDKSFNSFDQNYPVGSPCHIQGHRYNNVVGWLHPKDTMTTQEEAILKFLKDSGASEGDVRQGIAYVKEGTVSKLEKDVEDLKVSLNDLEEKVTEMNLKLEDEQESLVDCQKDLSIANKSLANKIKEFDICDNERKQWKSRYEAKCQETADKLNSYELFKLLIEKLFPPWKKSTKSGTVSQKK